MKTFSLLLATAIAAAAMLLTPCNANAQYKSADFDRAVFNGTRTNTGKPGEKYKNNFAEYKITASFDPDTQILEGEETVTFHYNMPGRGLGSIVFSANATPKTSPTRAWKSFLSPRMARISVTVLKVQNSPPPFRAI